MTAICSRSLKGRCPRRLTCRAGAVLRRAVRTPAASATLIRRRSTQLAPGIGRHASPTTPSFEAVRRGTDHAYPHGGRTMSASPPLLEVAELTKHFEMQSGWFGGPAAVACGRRSQLHNPERAHPCTRGQIRLRKIDHRQALDPPDRGDRWVCSFRRQRGLRRRRAQSSLRCADACRSFSRTPIRPSIRA